MDLTPFLGHFHSQTPGIGRCPGGRGVRFHETLSLTDEGRFVHYRQKAVEVDTGAVLHVEDAVLRDHGDGMELSLVMSSGRVELGHVQHQDDTLILEGVRFENDRKGVRGARRILRLDGDVLHKELWLATPVWPELTKHMWGTLVRGS